MSKVIRPSLESASSVAASARVACLQTSKIEKPCFCAWPDASCTLHSVDIEPEMSKTTMSSIAVFVAGASHLISTRAASSMPSTTLRAKLSCFAGAGGSSAGEFGGAGGAGSANALVGSRGDLFVMFFSCLLREMCVNVRVLCLKLDGDDSWRVWQNSSRAAFVGRGCGVAARPWDGWLWKMWLSDGCRVLASVLQLAPTPAWTATAKRLP